MQTMNPTTESQIRGTRALLISGDEEGFVQMTSWLRKVLIDELNFDQSRVKTVNAVNSSTNILREIGDFVQDSQNPGKDSAIVIVYCGHGGKGYFIPNHSAIDYIKLGRILNQYSGQFLFINSSCNSGSAIPPFEELGLLPQRGSVIASCRADQVVERVYEYNFFKSLVDSYRANRPFRKRRIVSPWLIIFNKLPLKLVEEGKRLEDVFIEKWDSPEETSIGERYTGLRQYQKVHTDYTESKLVAVQINNPVRCGLDLDYLLFAENAAVRAL